MASTFIIAEAGVNHNGDMDLAYRLIDVAVDAGADAVKFQTFKSAELVTRDAPKSNYQIANTGQLESQFEMLRKLELSEEAHRLLFNYCTRKEIQFMSTPFDEDSVDMLAKIFKMPVLKLPSGEITNARLLLTAARTGASVIMSTGMSSLDEVQTALGILAYGYSVSGNSQPSISAFREAFMSDVGQSFLKEKVTLLHCTTEYPAPFEDINLRAMDTLRDVFGLPVGLSDHSEGIATPIAAVARGAVVIEKHFTLDRTLPGPDHKASLEPPELKAMVHSIRQVENALGTGSKEPVPSELSNRVVARRSIVAAKNIHKGELFTEENLTLKRPGDGVSPLFFWDYIGKPSPRDYCADEKVNLI